MEISFQETNENKSWVLCQNDTEVLRVRHKYEHKESIIHEYMYPIFFIEPLDSIHFMDHIRRSGIRIYSYKGIDGRLIDSNHNLIACTWVNYKNIGMVVLGVSPHFFMLRFKKKQNRVLLISIYELNYHTAEKFQLNQEIKSSEWSLCEVCCKKTNKSCEFCNTLYCCRDCQIYDWSKHKQICGLHRKNEKDIKSKLNTH